MTRREAVLLAILFHALMVIVYLITPAEWFQVKPVIPLVPKPDQQMVYTRVEPLRELPPRAPLREAPYLKDQNFDNQKGGNTGTDAAIQFDSKGVDFGSWLRRFEQQVRRNWFIPQSAMMLHGTVVLTFYVHKNGALTDLQIVTPSGVQSFDLSSFNALKLSNPTVPLPPEYPDEKAFFTVKFLYNEPIR